MPKLGASNMQPTTVE